MPSNTSLYGSSATSSNVTSNNFTTLYSPGAGIVKTQLPYGNANVVALLNAGTDGANTVTNIVATGNITANNINANTVYSQGMAVQGYDFVQMQYSNGAALPVSPYDIGTGSWFYLDSGGATFQSNTTGTFNQVVLGNDGNVTADYFIGNVVGNITGSANYANYSNIANVANSVNVANVVGIGNIAVLNLDGNVSNVLHGNGYWGPESGNLNANYANFAGTVTNSAQPNITSVGTLVNVSVTGNITSVSGVFVGNGAGLTNINGANVNTVPTSNYAAYAGNVTIAGQSNITSLGTLTGLTSNGTVNFANAANVNLGSNSNIHISGGAANYALVTDGSGNLSWGQVANASNANYANYAGNLINGTSNVNTNGSGGNISISVNGTSNVVTVSDTRMTVSNLSILANALALGNNSGGTQGTNAISIGSRAGGSTQGNSSIAIGNAAGNVQGVGSIAIGAAAGSTQGTGGVSIGSGAGRGGVIVGQAQGGDAIAIGTFAGHYATAPNTIAIGYAAGFRQFNSNSIAIGAQAGSNVPLSDSIAIGAYAGFNQQGSNTIAIGANAGYTTQANNSIILNATGSNLNQTTANTFTVKPVRNANTANIMYYDNTTGEITYDVSTGITANSANFANYAGNVTVNAQANITSLGNLTSLTVSNAVGNTRSPITTITPQGNTVGTAGSPISLVSITDYGSQSANVNPMNFTFIKSRGNSTTPTTAFNNDAVFRIAGQVYNGNTYPRVINITSSAPNASSLPNSNVAWSGGVLSVTTGNPFGNITSNTATSPQNLLQFDQGGRLSILPGTYGATSAMSLSSFGSNSDGSGGGQIAFNRSRGSRDTASAVANNDILGGYSASGNNGSGSSNSSSVLSIVNTNYGAITPGSPIPNDVIIRSASNTAGYATTFRGNGQVDFPGNIVSTNANLGNLATANYFSGDGSLLSNVSATATPAGSNTQIQFNDGGAFGASANLTFDNSTNVLNATTFTGNTVNTIALNATTIQTTIDANSGLVNGYTSIITETPNEFLNFDQGFYRYQDQQTVISQNVYRARGNVSIPTAVIAGDYIYNQRFSAYSNVGYEYSSAGTVSVIVQANDGNGNIATNIIFASGTDLANSFMTFNAGLTRVNNDMLVGYGGAGNLQVYGNINTYNANLGNLATANFFSGDGSLLTNINPANVTRTFGSFTSNVTQTNSNVGNAVYMTLNNDEGSNGVSIVSSSQITTAQTGNYNIQFSAQMEKTDGGTDTVEIWLTKNGSSVANSATRLRIQGTSEKDVAAWNWLVNSANVNDYYEIAWASTDANMQLVAIGSGSTLSGVAVPSLIVTVVPVGA